MIYFSKERSLAPITDNTYNILCFTNVNNKSKTMCKYL